MSLLETTDLSVTYNTPSGGLQAVREVDIAVEKGETLGIVGESGCGKSTVAKSFLRALDKNGEINEGSILFEGEDISKMSIKELNERIRWKKISYIPQNAMNALDPVFTIGSQMMEVVQTHTDLSQDGARERSEQRLADVGLDEERMNDYAHELSGGQQQRVVIALALLLEPALIIADEITTGLDVVIQDEILELISDIQSDLGSGMVFITHDISAVAEVADQIAVMYGGEIIETGDIRRVFKEASHPYTIGLQNAFPSLESLGESDSLISIPGTPPDLFNPPSGCNFAERCPFSTDKCQHEPPLEKIDGKDHRSRCHYNHKSEEFRRKGRKAETWV